MYDGLVTTVDRWFREHWLRKRRFRFVGDHPVGFEGDVRLFVLSPSLNATEAPQVEPQRDSWWCHGTACGSDGLWK